MSVLQLDLLPTLNYYDEIVQLESLEYLLEFAWSDRESAFYLNIYDTDNSPLAVGIKLLLNVDLLRRFPDPRLPQGMLLCIDQGGNNADIATPEDLGTRVLLMYITADDASLVAAVAASSSTDNPSPTTSIAVSPTTLSLSADATSTLAAIASPSGADVSASVVWSSGDSSIASVDASGIVTAHANGVAAITATYDGILTAICYVTVTGAM